MVRSEGGTLVRAAALSDADAVWRLTRGFATSFTPERGAFDAAFTALVSRPDTLLAVAVRDGMVVGYLLASHHLTLFANGRVCWVEEVMVDADQRRHGVGRHLVQAAERWAADSGAAYVALATRRANAFYLALGYEESATFFKKTLG